MGKTHLQHSFEDPTDIPLLLSKSQLNKQKEKFSKRAKQ